MFSRRVFLVAPSFHGATLLSRLMDAHPQITSLGDTYPSNKFDQVCGCGSRVSTCPYWRSIKRAVRADRYADEMEMLPLTPAVLRNRIDRRIFRLTPIAALKRLVPANQLHRFAADYDDFLHAVHAQSAPKNPSVFVDGIKSAARVRAMICAGQPVDGIVHLLRSPGDFAKSSVRGKNWSSPALLALAALRWKSQHRDYARLARYAPYMCIRYEDLCEATDTVLAQIFRFLGVNIMNREELRLEAREPWHFMGNSSLFRFAWKLDPRRYPLSGFERRLIGLVSGR